ncbi:hypothetical protein [Fodinibius sp. AD559]|uniref:hypothetical protein n=1 Tax=Fodinibius sp. AD559 TaxID=3424179 RepID=UPI00404691C8
MNSESSYIYSDSHQDQGLGRIPPLTLSRSLPTIDKPMVRNRRIIQPKRIPLPKPMIKPRPLPKLRPVIDKNPLPPPARVKPIPRITKPKKRSKSDKTTTSPVSLQSSAKPAATKTASKSGGMLDGTVKVGGIEIEKKHAAVAGGATAGGLLLWKLLF